jgi:hypothetical protein
MANEATQQQPESKPSSQPADAPAAANPASQPPERDAVAGWLGLDNFILHPSSGVILLITAVLPLALSIYLFVAQRQNLWGVGVGTSLLTLVFLGTGAAQLLRPQGIESTPSRDRYLILVLRSGVGLSLAVAGLLQFINWSGTLADTLAGVNAAGGWRAARPALIAIFAFLLGLVVIFASLQSQREYERTDPVLRRLLYGYTAFLTGTGLALLLIAVNVASGMFLTADIDVARNGYLGLHQPTVEFLTKELKEPIRATVIRLELVNATERTLMADLRRMLSDMERVSRGKFKYTTVSPSDNLAMANLFKEYPQLRSKLIDEGGGIILAVGEDKDTRTAFIKLSELGGVDESAFMLKQEPTRTFNGEDKFLTEMRALTETVKPVIYVTQGHGEYNLDNETVPSGELFGVLLNDDSPGLGVLRRRLAKRNYDVRKLDLSGLAAGELKVPADAGVVLIPNPRQTFSEAAIKALRDYANTEVNGKKGRLLVFLEATASKRGNASVAVTGIESFLGEFGLKLPPEIIYAAPFDPQLPPFQIVEIRAANKTNPIAASFGRNIETLPRVRPVLFDASSKGPYRAEEVLTTAGVIWKEKDLTIDPIRTAQAFRDDNNLRTEKGLTNTPVPVAQAVSEGQFDKAKPRVVVYGCGSMISNINMKEGVGDPAFDLVLNSLGWLAERPTTSSIVPEPYKTYRPEGRISNLQLAPLFTITLGVVVLGLSVLVIRRK